MLEAKESEAKLAVGKLEPPWLENTHFFSLTCFPVSPISSSAVVFPSRFLYPPLILSPVHKSSCLSFSAHFFVPLIFWGPLFSVCSLWKFLSLYLLLSVVSFSFTSTDLQTYSMAVSSLFIFHLPILTLICPFWGFFPFVCLTFFLLWHFACANPCYNPFSAKTSFPTVLIDVSFSS